MAHDFRSAHWYRVASLRPKLAPQVTTQRQSFRGRPWYVLFDPLSQRSLRLTPAAWHAVARMDGATTLQEVWESTVSALDADAPAQHELIQLLTQLHEADLLVSDAVPDLDELLRRRDRRRRDNLHRNLLNPLALRLRLWDPDRFLGASLPAVRWLFSPLGAALWLALCLTALLLAAMHGDELRRDLGGRLLGAGPLLGLAFVYPVIKALHELGHGWAAKAGGAEVHDMGLMFLVLAPVPYVDASGSTAFASKYRRALVAAAGILTELALAALALFVWLAVEPGWTQAVALDVMLIGGVSTLLFNGNPLLRYDGYFVLCDLIESPNLAQRSAQYWRWLARHHLFGVPQVAPPEATVGEKRWFLCYGPASWVYRIVITAGIALFLGREYLYVGLAVGLWGLGLLLVWPLMKGLHYLLHAPELTGRRMQPLLVSAGGMSLLLVLVAGVPLPLSTYAQGVVWPEEQAQLRSAQAGFVDQVAVSNGQAVQRGAVVMRLTNDRLQTERATAAAREQRDEQRWQAAFAGARAQRDAGHGQVVAQIQHAAWEQARRARAEADARVALLAVWAPREGQVEIPRAEDLPGRWVRQGETLGQVDTGEPPTVRVVVGQEDIALVRAGLLRVEVRLAGRLGEVLPARLLREVPGGDDTLPSAALSVAGGGLVAVAPGSPRDPRPPRALNRVFQFDLALPAQAAGARLGERAHVRFVHGEEPLVQQLARRLRQLLLSQLNL
jgi:putative peptide zinc metalloprotease protein